MQKEKVIYKGKARIWIGSIIAAFVAAVSVFAVMMQMEKNLLTKYAKDIIFIAAKEIPKGQLITEDNYEVYFEEMEVDQNCIPATALTSIGQIQSLAAVEDIEQGVLLTLGMFERLEDITAEMKEPVIAGFKAEDLYQVVGGTLRAGDRIHIYSMDEEGGVTLHWKNVYVQQVFDNAGNMIASGDEQLAAQRVNIYLDSLNVEQFYSQLGTGTLRVVKVCD